MRTLYTLLAPHLRLDVPFVPHLTALCDELNGRGLHIAGAIEAIDVCRLEVDRVRSLAHFELEGLHAEAPR